eukprot:CAMPEP_0118972326 /NCGR_PEP_ID=MMETSP1173-20130426/8657_1 /TAXON_ID=1034831 /ORGANISM="Rhizochromulina marina cf, Strain CCMP1243" /LENGTH=466 /DNA_ID=CAMNT_0006921851 /DNA_START=27 /DNA_END=1427 /DNA_ORIENTATION=-
MRSLSLSAAAVALLATGAEGYTSEAIADQIETLPGAPEVGFNQFSGYLDINPDTGLKYFYWFVECDGCDAATAPVALWTNGGPGCSGLIGFMTEQGPFRPQEDGTLTTNPYAWNKAANYLFIEQPVGVGFSYSTTKSDYINVGDDMAAENNYKLIKEFLNKFPEYGSNEFYITAESYGGHYMPTLAKYIVDHNEDGAINFKGFAVGNPYTDPVENALGTVDTIYGHQLVPRPTYLKWQKLCKNGSRQTTACQLLQAKMWDAQMGNLNPYALDYPVCLDSDGNRKFSHYQARIAQHMLPKPAQKSLGLPSDPEDYEPCADNWATDYLNRADVKEAIHANSEITWAQCSSKTPYGTLVYNYSWSEVYMEPYYEYLINGDYGLKILVLSGDDDSVCGTIGTQSWIYDIAEVTSDWTSWEVDGQVAGYVEKFDGFTFATVHGAGHEVPTYKPAQALKLISAYFNGSSWLF